ncbi:MAG: YegP family protein [Candidatus Zixiibacteriota bacterium]|nr:MAG: YegP family protein [candidate division Zixibacteria bacterium]
MENSKFQILRGENKQYYFRLRTGRGDIILQSEGYNVRAGAEKGIDIVRISVCHNDRFRRKMSADGKYYFEILTIDGDILGTSKLYESLQGCDNGIFAVKDLVPKAVIENSGM